MPNEVKTTFLVAVALGACTAAVGTFLLQSHPTRRLVWKPVGFLVLLGATLTAIANADVRLIGGLVGCGLVTFAASQKTRTLDAVVLLGLIAFLSFLLGPEIWTTNIGIAIAVVAGFELLISAWLYRRPVGETLGEWLLRIMYRMRVDGPGVAQLPRMGPVLVIANHTAFLDPCWVMIPLPRDLTPIMFSDYFKKFGLHFYMKHIINAIPSGGGTVRREAPELAEVVRRLDLGEGILVFPEGWVRRKEEEPIRRFAQGPWRVLRDRPTTPVVACWIEGGWGSWSSFWNGPPFKGKRLDLRRPINVGVSAPVVLDAETLADQLRTRELLKQMVIDARKHLGLPPIAACGLATDR
jgi:1-acyl-sn-glycerol-3-phosphate acyltransferase